MRRSVRYALLIALFSTSRAFSAIEMKCASVSATGTVTITWNNNGPSAGFYAYYIYHSDTAASTFSRIDSVLAFGTQTYTDANANAMNVNAFYYVTVQNTSGGIVMGDTVEAIKLSVIKTGGYASLAWNATHLPLIVTNSVFYKIYREYPAGVWTLIDSIDLSSNPSRYSDEITICSDSINYRVEVSDGTGCISVSSIDGKYFQDVTAPTVPIIDSVSVDINGNAVLGWNQNPSKDTYAYVIYHYVGGTGIFIDSAYGISNTFFATTINATTASQQFYVVAIDSCSPTHNTSFTSVKQETMLLTGLTDICNASLRLNWNAYINSPSSPAYTILMSENGAAETIIGSTATTTFNVRNLKSDTTYCFRIRAVLDTLVGTSTSNQFCLRASLPAVPQFVYIKQVSVNSASEIMTIAFVDTHAIAKEHRLLRSSSPLAGFHTVGTLPAVSNPIITFIDGGISDADKKVYYYEVESTDSCGSVAAASQISHTIVPSVISNVDFTDLISWNNYGQWLGGDSFYVVLQSIDSSGSFIPIGTVLYGDSSFRDDSPINFYSSGGKFCYRIVAYEGSRNSYGFSDSSYSATVCTGMSSAVFTPNAFRPSSLYNNVFNPAERFVSYEGYDLKIFNRWGQVVFESTDPALGWNGISNGKISPPDVYTWLLNYKSGKGEGFRKFGVVTLVE